MQARLFAMITAAALLGAGCASKETKPEPVAAPAAATESAAKAPEPAPVASKPVCPPEPSAKVKTTKSGKAAKGKEDPKAKKSAAAPDCEPASSATKSSASAAKAAPAEPAPAPAKEASKEPAAKATAKSGEAQKAKVVKSRDGTFEGEIYGNIPPGSKWAKLQIGMEQPEVERILGGSSNDVRYLPTAKAFIPFYYGTDSHRYEVVYRGQGSVSYTGGSWGSGRGVLMMINYDPNM